MEPIQAHRFQSTPEKGEVSALLWRPNDAQHLLVFGHGAGAGMAHPNMEGIAAALASREIATFRYQFPFMERGGGRDSEAVSLATVAAAVEQARDLVPDLPVWAGGHSFGGRMTSLAAARGLLPELKGLVFGSFPLHPAKKLATQRAAHLPEISLPMLFLSGDRDALAEAELLQGVLQGLPQASLHWLEAANHGYQVLKRSRKSPEPIFAEMARVIQHWMEQTEG
jgi:uncharacterized protein